VLHGLAAVNEFRGRYHVSEEILKQLLGAGDSPLAVEAHELLACSTFHQGRAATAVRYAEAGLALYDEDRDSGFLAPYGEHPAVACHDWAALALWFLGHPDRAMAHATRALALAREHAYSLAAAEVQLTYLHQYRGERDETLRWAGRAAATAATHGFPIRAAQAAIFGGWARAAAGDGVDELRAGLDAYLATGAELDHPYYLGLLGDAVARTAGPAEGLAVLEEAVELVGTARPSTTCPSCTGSAATCWPPTAAPPRPPTPTGGPLGSRPGTAPGRPSCGRPSACAACPSRHGRREPWPSCGGSTTSSRRGSAPPTCWPPGPCWRRANRAGAGGPGPR
jgi:hypothetical protein